MSANKRLVIPEFGAFLRKETGQVVFMEFLKKDDGVLSGLLAGEYGISQQEAMQTIANFIAEIKKRVADSGSFHLEGLGYLRCDVNGVFELSAQPASVPSGTSGENSQEEVPPRAPVSEGGTPGEIAADFAQTQSSSGSDRKATFTGLPGTPAAERTTRQDRPVPPTGSGSGRTQANGSEAASSPARTTAPTKPPAPRVIVHAPKTDTPADKIKAPGEPAAKKQPRSAPGHAPRKKKLDLVMIIAIIAAVAALGAMAYGILAGSDPIIKMQPTAPTEQVDHALPADNDTPEELQE